MVRNRVYALVISAALFLPTNTVVSHAEPIPVEFHGLWLVDTNQICPDPNLSTSGIGLFISDKTYISDEESNCKFTGTVKHSCCDTETKKTISASFKCGNFKNKVVLHIEKTEGNFILVETFENDSSGPNTTIYRKRCDVLE